MSRKGAMRRKAESCKRHMLGAYKVLTYQNSLIWRGIMQGTKSKNEKSRPKNNSFGTVRGCNEAEKSEPSKSTSTPPNEFTYKI